MEYHRRISKYPKGREQNWFVDVMDTTTRFMVSSCYMRSRTINNMVKVLKRGKFATGDQVKIITTKRMVWFGFNQNLYAKCFC